MTRCYCDACDVKLLDAGFVHDEGLCDFCQTHCFQRTSRTTRLMLTREERERLHRDSRHAPSQLGVQCQRLMETTARTALAHAGPLAEQAAKKVVEHLLSTTVERILGGKLPGPIKPGP